MTLFSLLVTAIAGTCINGSEPFTEPVDSFPLPSVPATLTAPAERAEYVTAHFFDSVILPENPSQGLEMAIANFTTVAPLASQAAWHKAAATLYGRATNDKQRERVREVIESYLSGTDSPYLNLDLFAVFLSEDSPGVRRDGLLRLAEANKIGTPAADVSLLLADGSTATLGSIIQRTPETVLIFFDPECERCRELTLELSADIRLAEAIQSGEICVVALTPGGDIPTKPDFFPETWVHATDSDGAIDTDDLYFIPSFPEIYIISRDSNIVKARGLRSVSSVMKELGL